MGSRRDGSSRRNSLPRFKAGSRPAPNTVCTYDLGHVRQDVYACRRCTPAFDKLAKASGMGPGGLIGLPSVEGIVGFCGGCKQGCHGDHLEDVIDLYSKRGFRCDCGSSAMRGRCTLRPDEARAPAPANRTVYNHNFVGKYCRCDRGYDPALGDMLQCAVCEDWFHEACARLPNGAPAARNSALSAVQCELVCAACARRAPLLDDYFAQLGLFQPERAPRALPSAARGGARPPGCARPPAVEKGALAGRDLFWPQGWRTRLCRCKACTAEYARLGVAFLVDRRDFVSLAGIDDDDDDALPVPDTAQAARDVVEKSKRRRAAGHAGSDPEFSDGDDEKPPPRRRRARSRTQRAGEPGATVSARARRALPEAQRRHIRVRVAAFLSSAISKPGQKITPLDVKHCLAQIRSEIVMGEVQTEEK